MPQSLAQVWLHIDFSTKDRRTLLKDASNQEEVFRMLCAKHGIEINERYVWDQRLFRSPANDRTFGPMFVL